MQQNLRTNIDCLGEEKAVTEFLKESRHITSGAQKFFEQIKDTTPDEHIDYTNLLIQDKAGSTPKVPQLNNGKFVVDFTCSGIPMSYKLSNRKIAFTMTTTISIGASSVDKPSAVNNLWFSHASIATLHAELKYHNNKIYIRKSDKNGNKLTAFHNVSHPQELHSGDTVQLGQLSTIITFSAKTSSKKSTHVNAHAVKIKLTSDDIQIPERVVGLNSKEQTIIGKSRPSQPAAIGNALFTNNYISYRHALIWFADKSLYIKPIGPVYIGNVPISDVTRLTIATIVTLGEYNSTRSFQMSIHSIEKVTRYIYSSLSS